MRLEHSQDSVSFAEWLLDVGHGRAHVNGDHSKVQLPTHMLRPTPQALLDAIYGDLSSQALTPPPPDYFLNQTILSARNEDVDEINQLILDRMPGEECLYHSADTVLCEPGADSPDVPHPHRSYDHPIPRSIYAHSAHRAFHSATSISK